jgi:hypothetical protein
MLAMECSVTLRNAIEGLYTAFSDYPLPKFTDPCLHCHSLEDEAKLRSAPLREIDSDHLRDYAVDALLVWGEYRFSSTFSLGSSSFLFQHQIRR